ncbi:MAG TPA: hypothetical protein VHM27_06470 [Rhizomicrobium sp.]|jgi:hypothetical protein|nr:hypothetical protein [Rhizomicrobium sp.]
MRITLLTALGLLAPLTAANAQYYGPAANPPSPQQLNSSRGTYTQPFGTDPRATTPYVNRGNLNVNGYNPDNVASPYGQQAPLTSGGYSLGGLPAKKP